MNTTPQNTPFKQTEIRQLNDFNFLPAEGRRLGKTLIFADFGLSTDNNLRYSAGLNLP
jgi:hypothetical protein